MFDSSPLPMPLKHLMFSCTFTEEFAQLTYGLNYSPTDHLLVKKWGNIYANPVEGSGIRLGGGTKSNRENCQKVKHKMSYQNLYSLLCKN